jgi:catabolite repression protein CreC
MQQLSRHRTDSLSNRKRSDSDRTEKPIDTDEPDVLCHPVEQRKMTALLPPVMVRFYPSPSFPYPKPNNCV